jgi:hypothetical protein
MRASHLRDMHFAYCRKSKYKTTRGFTRLTRHPHASNSEAWLQFIVRHYLMGKSIADHLSFLRTLIIKQNPPDARFSSSSTLGKSKGSTNSKWFHQHRPKLQARVRSLRFIQHQLILPCQQVLEALHHQRTNRRKPQLFQTKSPMTMPSQSSHPTMTHQSRPPFKSSTPRSGSRPQSPRNL